MGSNTVVIPVRTTDRQTPIFSRRPGVQSTTLSLDASPFGLDVCSCRIQEMSTTPTFSFHCRCFSPHEKVVDFRSTFMAALSKAERSKVYPAAKAAILSKYVNYHDIPKWSEIGTLVRKDFRRMIISQLQITDCGDVAEYLKLHENEIDAFVHRKVKSLRERKFWRMS